LAKQARIRHFGRTPIRHFRERKRDMREELDGRMWADHHDRFVAWVGDAAKRVRGGLDRFAGWDGSSHQLLAMIAALAVTGLSLIATNSAA
jgi:hypothetical protein